MGLALVWAQAVCEDYQTICTSRQIFNTEKPRKLELQYFLIHVLAYLK